MAEKKQAPLNTLLTIYFYHTRLTRESYEEWKEYKFPGHILYGLPLLENYGIHSVMHKCKYFSSRLKLMFYATKEILFCKEKYDVLYATSFRGIEPVIFLRALGLYRKPIVIWHHTAVVTNPKPWREQISRLFYKGIDQMFLFSRKLIQDSQKTRKAPSLKLKLIH
ncbi:glycosyltransferase family 1 protein, partial [Bacteroides ovatus]